MKQSNPHYYLVEKAIIYMVEHRRMKPSLAEVAAHVHVSPHHFQRVFKKWAGISPKRFWQAMTLIQAREKIRTEPSLFDSAEVLGLSGTGRLHDLFVTLESMTPGQYKRDGEGLSIEFEVSHNQFGRYVVAATQTGICYLGFLDCQEDGYTHLLSVFPKATLLSRANPFFLPVARFFENMTSTKQQIPLHVNGTPFQLKVWEALLKIPEGQCRTYSELASEMGRPKAARAVGSAIGQNPIAYLIPCHRVIRASGALGGYRWGESRKISLLLRETVEPVDPDN